MEQLAEIRDRLKSKLMPLMEISILNNSILDATLILFFCLYSEKRSLNDSYEKTLSEISLARQISEPEINKWHYFCCSHLK